VYEYVTYNRSGASDFEYFERYVATLGKNCLDVKLSSKGHLAMVYDDHVEVLHMNGRHMADHRAERRIQKVAFSEDGDTLCVWRNNEDRRMENWHFYTISTSKMDGYGDWKYYNSPSALLDDVAAEVDQAGKSS